MIRIDKNNLKLLKKRCIIYSLFFRVTCLIRAKPTENTVKIEYIPIQNQCPFSPPKKTSKNGKNTKTPKTQKHQKIKMCVLKTKSIKNHFIDVPPKRAENRIIVK